MKIPPPPKKGAYKQGFTNPCYKPIYMKPYLGFRKAGNFTFFSLNYSDVAQRIKVKIYI